MLYSGKAAEEAIFGECSIGASNDLERATYLLRDYVGAYGMLDNNLLSLVGLAKDNMMISANEDLLKRMNETANSIYREVEGYFEDIEVQEIVQKMANLLCEQEVIYDFEVVLSEVKNDIMGGKSDKV